jgi:primosomal protein N' (replication factor Y)
MIVKGHDFPDVTLVGILAADMSLYGNDYESAERTYQLLVQAAGRAGRADRHGEVVIQSYTPEHYSIVTAAANDYNKFYGEEIEYRRLLGYPPILNMLRIAFSLKDSDRLEAVCADIKDWSGQYAVSLKEADSDDDTKNALYISGPVHATVYKVKDYYSQILCVKSVRREALIIFKEAAEAYIKENRLYDNVLVQYDFSS